MESRKEKKNCLCLDMLGDRNQIGQIKGESLQLTGISLDPDDSAG